MQRKDKLTPRNQGPYEVIAHIPDTNWVDTRCLVTGVVHRFDLKDLQIFIGTRADGQKLVEFDLDQHRVLKVTGHRGNPEIRTTMEFLVHFQGDKDGTWMTYSADLIKNEVVDSYCTNLPQLQPLTLSAKQADTLKKRRKTEDITLVQPYKSVAYVDIRSWGPGTWYSSLALPDKDTTTYVLKAEYRDFCGPAAHPKRRINVYFETIGATYPEDNWFVCTYGHKYTELHPTHVLLTKQLLSRYRVNLTDN